MSHLQHMTLGDAHLSAVARGMGDLMAGLPRQVEPMWRTFRDRAVGGADRLDDGLAALRASSSRGFDAASASFGDLLRSGSGLMGNGSQQARGVLQLLRSPRGPRIGVGQFGVEYDPADAPPQPGVVPWLQIYAGEMGGRQQGPLRPVGSAGEWERRAASSHSVGAIRPRLVREHLGAAGGVDPTDPAALARLLGELRDYDGLSEAAYENMMENLGLGDEYDPRDEAMQ